LIVRILQYSFTISLGFPALASLFAGSVVTGLFLVRYRASLSLQPDYMLISRSFSRGIASSRSQRELLAVVFLLHTDVKRLPTPSPPSLSSELLPSSTSALSDARNRSVNPFHNYLDDFLSAIRIFGFLEKPVFHELSRHLQTRRLAAGETLEIGGGDFWCVVEGKVQVVGCHSRLVMYAERTQFAPSSTAIDALSSPPSPDPFASNSGSSFNGYHLLNEVSTGGTLSSLFSVLSLFTEDIKLSWSPIDEAEGDDQDGDVTMKEDQQSARPRDKSRANSDVSQLDFDTLGVHASDTGEEFRRLRTTSISTLEGTIRGSTSPTGSEPNSPQAETMSPPFRKRRSSRTGNHTPAHTPGFSSRSRRSDRDHSPEPLPKRLKPAEFVSGSAVLKGTIARATVDTTLAVIPAEAFRKLTRKFPKASGTIVSVVLERFARVTFMTGE
jgi:lysophospholipid hydrolase